MHINVYIWIFLTQNVWDKVSQLRSKISVLFFLQGFFIFILHVLRSDDVRAEFNRKKQNWKDKRSVASSRTTLKHSSDMWANKVTNSDSYELNNKPNEATSRPASGYDNPLVLYQQGCMTRVDTWLSRDQKVDDPHCNYFILISSGIRMSAKCRFGTVRLVLYSLKHFRTEMQQIVKAFAVVRASSAYQMSY